MRQYCRINSFLALLALAAPAVAERPYTPNVTLEKSVEFQVLHPTNVCNPQENEASKAVHAVMQRDLRSQVFYR
jgi:hypothetical protein